MTRRIWCLVILVPLLGFEPDLKPTQDQAREAVRQSVESADAPSYLTKKGFSCHSTCDTDRQYLCEVGIGEGKVLSAYLHSRGYTWHNFDSTIHEIEIAPSNSPVEENSEVTSFGTTYRPCCNFPYTANLWDSNRECWGPSQTVVCSNMPRGCGHTALLVAGPEGNCYYWPDTCLPDGYKEDKLITVCPHPRVEFRLCEKIDE